MTSRMKHLFMLECGVFWNDRLLSSLISVSFHKSGLRDKLFFLPGMLSPQPQHVANPTLSSQLNSQTPSSREPPMSHTWVSESKAAPQ